MATTDNRLPTEGTQIDIESRLAAIETALASLMADTTGQSIATAITALGSTLGSDKANIDGSNIANPSAFRSAIGVSARNTPFDNTGTGLASSDAQEAIEEVNEKANTALQISNGSITAPWGTTASITRIAQFKSMLIIGGRLDKGFMVLVPSGTNEYVILCNINSCITNVSVTSSAINITMASSGYGSNIIINTIVLI